MEQEPKKRDEFRYLGQFDPKMDTEDVVRAMAWCPNPRNYITNCQDIIATTGNFGTRLHKRMKPKEEEGTIERDWTLLTHRPNVKGHKVIWNPSQECRSGDLAIQCETFNTPDQLHIMTCGKNSFTSEHKLIYDASGEGSRISTFCWCSDGNTILVVIENSDTIQYLKWNMDTRQWMKHKFSFGLGALSVGCVPSRGSMSRDLFAAAGIRTPIKIFKRTEMNCLRKDPDRHWDEICTWSECIDISSMSFSPNGLVLAVVSTEGEITLFRVYSSLYDEPSPSSRLMFIPVQRLECFQKIKAEDYRYSHLAWSGDSFLVMSGNTLGTVGIIQFVEYSGTMHDCHDNIQALFDGKDCIDPFNYVRQPIVCPRRSGLMAVLGYESRILFWESSHTFKRVKRQVFLEKFPKHMPPMVNKLAMFPEEMDKQWKSLVATFNDSSAQQDEIVKRWRDVGNEIKVMLEDLYAGKTLNCVTTLEKLYGIGRYQDQL